jgi:hypothetical protein
MLMGILDFLKGRKEESPMPASPSPEPQTESAEKKFVCESCGGVELTTSELSGHNGHEVKAKEGM